MARDVWSLDDYEIHKELSTGHASYVYQATCRASGLPVALKVYRMKKLSNLSRYQVFREISVHAGLSHPNIVRLYAAFQEGSVLVLVQEFARGGDLYGFLQKHLGCLTEEISADVVLRPLLRALVYCHTKGVVHRDIKLENILLTHDRVIKLADFGLAIDLKEERAVTRAGTLDYMAPEVLRCPPKLFPEENKHTRSLAYGCGVDVWSVGILASELVMGCTPFPPSQQLETAARLREAPPKMPLLVSSACRAFIAASLRKHPTDRPSMQQLLNMPWLSAARSGTYVAAAPAAQPSSTVARAAAALSRASPLGNVVPMPPRAVPTRASPRKAPWASPRDAPPARPSTAPPQQQQQQHPSALAHPLHQRGAVPKGGASVHFGAPTTATATWTSAGGAATAARAGPRAPRRAHDGDAHVGGGDGGGGVDASSGGDAWVGGVAGGAPESARVPGARARVGDPGRGAHSGGGLRSRLLALWPGNKGESGSGMGSPAPAPPAAPRPLRGSASYTPAGSTFSASAMSSAVAASFAAATAATAAASSIGPATPAPPPPSAFSYASHSAVLAALAAASRLSPSPANHPSSAPSLLSTPTPTSAGAPSGSRLSSLLTSRPAGGGGAAVATDHHNRPQEAPAETDHTLAAAGRAPPTPGAPAGPGSGGGGSTHGHSHGASSPLTLARQPSLQPRVSRGSHAGGTGGGASSLPRPGAAGALGNPSLPRRGSGGDPLAW
ncbi:hypothetical protein FOA52_012009 [Chlamydomonas sp. UWO 241]|nr:hypothetical protein FOA52_012009 [Chlamydomonas sp. UWO 241]